MALTPGCAMLWKARNTVLRWDSGMRGRRVPVDVSQTRLTPLMRLTAGDNESETPAAATSGQVRCETAMAAKSTTTGGPGEEGSVTAAMTGTIAGSSGMATTAFSPPETTNDPEGLDARHMY